MTHAEKRHVCIYCGKTNPMSKEHIIANWVGNVIEVPYKSSILLHERFARNDTLFQKEKPERHSTIINKKLRRVCIKCNTGWMRGLQDDTKPVVGPLIRGDWHEIDRKKTAIISAWAAMTVMNIDYSFYDPPGVSDSERRFLMENRRPPGNWRIYMGRRTGEQSVGILHSSVYVGPKDKSSGTLDTNLRNSQITTVVLGQYVFHALSLPPEVFGDNTLGYILDPIRYGKLLGVVPVFPSWGGDILDWHFAPIHHDEQTTALARFAYDLLRSPFTGITPSVFI